MGSNPWLAAVRRVAYGAADSGLLHPELAAHIRRVRGVRRLGVRVRNWPAAGQGERLLQSSARDNLTRQGEFRHAGDAPRMYSPSRPPVKLESELDSAPPGTLGQRALDQDHCLR